MRMNDKVALVTGASYGIGEAIGKRFAREGATVIVNYLHSDDSAEQVVKDITADGGKAETCKADCSDVAQINRMIGDIESTHGGIDVLVNNAGVFRTMPIEETTEEIWDEQLDLNLKGPFFLTKAVFPGMKARGGGKVVNISSIAGVGAFPNCAGYCAAKGGLVNLTKALSLELGKHKINVNSIAPGNVATPLNAHLRTPDMADYMKQMRDMTPTGVDFMNPEDLTGTAVYLATADSDMVHGETILVDAGWCAW